MLFDVASYITQRHNYSFAASPLIPGSMENHRACGASQENGTLDICTDHIYYIKESTVRVRHSVSVKPTGLILWQLPFTK